MQQDSMRSIEETTIWSEVPDLRDKLVRLLRIRGLLDRPTIDRVLEKSAAGGGTVAQVLLESDLMQEDQLVTCLEQASGYPALDPRLQQPDPELIAKVGSTLAIQTRALPVKIQDKRLLVVMENPNDPVTKQVLSDVFAVPVDPYIHHTQAIFDAIGRAFPAIDTQTLVTHSRQEGSMRVEAPRSVQVTELEETRGLLFTPVSEVLRRPLEMFTRPLLTQKRTVTKTVTRTLPAAPVGAYSTSNDSAPAVVDAILTQAIESGSSDIHLEPMQDAIRIRIRQDQMLATMNYLAIEMHTSLINRIKVLASLDVAERRKVQEGSFRFQPRGGKRTHFRVSMIPTSRGESAELRVIDGRQGRWDLAQLGMSEVDLERFERNLYYPNGLILVTGPTASGKTTTMYSALKRLNVEGRKILTAEDPIEYDLYGITQVEANPKTDLTYAKILKAFLRQDPDVMMLGEIRDPEVAQVAIGAAMTGHLVLAALHTNDSASAATRLMQTLECDPMLVCDALLMIASQRLVRNLCPHGKQPKAIDPAMREVFGDLLDGLEHDWVSPGCEKCRNTGYKGVTAVFEVMDVTARIKEHIFDRVRPSALFKTACEEGMRPMILNALDEVKAGRTNLTELKRVLTYKRLF